MKRLEIIANRSIEEDMFELFEKKNLVAKFTKIPAVRGSGVTEPKQGDHVWPEENFLLIVYCSDEEALHIKEVLMELKSYFPTEGIRLFEMHAQQTV
jgi:hypothetical protein